MKILQICSKVPFPPKDGGCLAMHNITKGLLDDGHTVQVIAVNTQKHYVDVSKIDSDYIQATKLAAVYIDTSVTFWGVFKSLFVRRSYQVTRFNSLRMAVRIAKTLKKQEFDIVQLESIYVAQYLKTIRRHSTAKVVLRAHNVEHEIWQKMAEESKNPLKRIYYYRMSKRLKTYESEIYSKFDGIAAITMSDAKKIQTTSRNSKIAVIPFGFDFTKTEAIPVQSPISFFHIGAMDWQPNVESIKWFVENIWMKIKEEIPGHKLHLAGRKMPDWLFQFNNDKSHNLVVIGEVASSTKFIHNKSVMISPLLAGSGMRIKIIESMAMGKAVITTTLGAQGIECENKKDILIADTEDEFKQAIKYCINNPNEVEVIGLNARQLIQQKYSNPVIIDKLVDFYHTLSKK